MKVNNPLLIFTPSIVFSCAMAVFDYYCDNIKGAIIMALFSLLLIVLMIVHIISNKKL